MRLWSEHSSIGRKRGGNGGVGGGRLFEGLISGRIRAEAAGVAINRSFTFPQWLDERGFAAPP